MQFWFARNASVSIREQLVTQLMLAIASGELVPGSRLPSTRALAKRFQLHPNTVSAAYQQLQDLGRVQPVRGSGVYVCPGQDEAGAAQRQVLDRLALDFVRGARAAGLTASALQARLNQWLEFRPSRFVFVHPDEGLRTIVTQELREAVKWEVMSVEPNPAGLRRFASDSVILTVPSKLAEVRAIAPAHAELLPLHVRSVAGSLATYPPVRPEMMIIVASCWPTFLEIARTVLTAVGCDPDAVQFRNTNEDGWGRGVAAGSMVVCDVFTAAGVPACAHKVVFPLVSDPAIAGLKAYEHFHGL